mmetsp:Transcript_35675/g.65426  ORF Transcript_35675/g.65426 Transcript_35675/m.65426 type:complete len:889 (-) Transcript_35675:104-2770(-)
MPPAWVGSVLSGPLRALGKKSLPETHGEFYASELEEPEKAEISRDEYGAPHITAATEHDLYFLNGVVHAQDRLWQLHSGRMLAAGRLCELGGIKALDTDKLIRQLGFRRLAVEDVEALRACGLPGSMEANAMMEAYAQGVNWYAGQAAAAGRLPLEFKLTGLTWEPWTVTDSCSLVRFWSFAMNYGFQSSLLRRGLEELFGTERASAWTCSVEAEDNIPCVVDQSAWDAFLKADLSSALGAAGRFPKGQGSNWWILAGTKTTTGKPILTGDPHLQIRIPNFWYEVHMEQQAGIQVHGLAPPGVPGYLIGQNGFNANSITLGYCDVEDVFLERVRRSDGKYLHKGSWYDCEVHKETIKVKKAAPVECLCRATCHGPLLEGDVLAGYDAFRGQLVETQKSGCGEGEDILVAYAAIALRRKSLYPLGLWQWQRAKSFREYDAALGLMSRTYCLNVGYADVNGNIGYMLLGEAPNREGFRGVERHPLAGWTGQYDWTSFVEHSKLPKAFNPPSGVIISANHKVVDYKYYPYYLGQTWKSGYRAQAIKEELDKILGQGMKASPEQMPVLLTNVKSCAAVNFVEELRHVTPMADTKEAMDLLLNWDGVLRPDSVPASLYQVAHAELVKLLVDGGCSAIAEEKGLGKGKWAGVDAGWLSGVVGGEAFDVSQTMKFLNEFQGHVHLNVLRILRAARQKMPDSAGVDRTWWLTQVGGRDAAVNEALRRSIAQLQKLAGTGWTTAKAAQWGQLHIANFAHPLTKGLGLPAGSKPFDCPPLPCGGDTNTIAQAAAKSTHDLSANSSQASLRVCFDLSDLKNSATNRIIMPLGQSGHFVSPHYSDQTAHWSSGKMRAFIVADKDVKQQEARRVMSFTSKPTKGKAASGLGKLVALICCRD